MLGFPCNQFGGQEPGSAQEIATFCSQKYDVTFPMFAKIDVNGDKALPLFDHLKREKPGLLGASIKWNFTKFLVDRARQGRRALRLDHVTRRAEPRYRKAPVIRDAVI